MTTPVLGRPRIVAQLAAVHPDECRDVIALAREGHDAQAIATRAGVPIEAARFWATAVLDITGKSSRQIAEQLGLSRRTVVRYRALRRSRAAA